MKQLLTLVLLSLALAIQATPPPPIVSKTGKISLQWSASPTPAVSYKLYHSTNNVTWDKTYSGITGTAYTVTNVAAGSSNWFSVVAVNADAIESTPSNVVEKPIDAQPAPATGLMSVPVVVNVESRAGDGAWAKFRSYTNHIVASTDEPEREFRSFVSIGTPSELVTPR